ncbi:hypothetical protein D3C76_387670 [compost metagenome]
MGQLRRTLGAMLDPLGHLGATPSRTQDQVWPGRAQARYWPSGQPGAQQGVEQIRAGGNGYAFAFVGPAQRVGHGNQLCVVACVIAQQHPDLGAIGGLEPQRIVGDEALRATFFILAVELPATIRIAPRNASQESAPAADSAGHRTIATEPGLNVKQASGQAEQAIDDPGQVFRRQLFKTLGCDEILRG